MNSYKTAETQAYNDIKTAKNGRKQQLKFISYMQVIGIILVVLGHSMHEYPERHGYGTLLYQLIYSFHMPLFMFVSGFLMIYSARGRDSLAGWTGFFRSKAKRLLLPFITLSAVTFFPRAAMSSMADDSVEMSVQSFLRSFIFHDNLVIPFFWFLQVLFVLLVTSYTIYLLFRFFRVKELYFYIFTTIVGILLYVKGDRLLTFFSLCELFDVAVYFAIGMVYARYCKSVDRLIPWGSPAVCVTLILAWISMFYLYKCDVASKPLCTTMGIAMCMSVSKILEKFDHTFIDHLIGANYTIFLLSWYCNIASQQVLHHFVELPWWCYSALSLFSGIYIPWAVYRIMSEELGIRN